MNGALNGGGPVAAIAATSVPFLSTENIQKYLDEDQQLIMAILENQNLGRVQESSLYQTRLQQNLILLASLADQHSHGMPSAVASPSYSAMVSPSTPQQTAPTIIQPPPQPQPQPQPPPAQPQPQPQPRVANTAIVNPNNGNMANPHYQNPFAAGRNPMGNMPNSIANRGGVPPNGQPFNPNSYSLPGGNKAGEMTNDRFNQNNRMQNAPNPHPKQIVPGNPPPSNINNLPPNIRANMPGGMPNIPQNIQQNIGNMGGNNIPTNPNIPQNLPQNIPQNVNMGGMPGGLQQFLQATKGNLSALFLSLGQRMTSLLPPQLQGQIQHLAQKKMELTNRQKNLKAQSDKLATEAALWQRTQAEYTQKMAEVTQQHRNISQGQQSNIPHPQINQMRATFQKLAEEKKTIVMKHNYLIESNTSIRQQSSELSDEMIQQQNRQGILDQQLVLHVQQNPSILHQLQQQLQQLHLQQQTQQGVNAGMANQNTMQSGQTVQPNRPFQGFSAPNTAQNPFLNSDMEMGGPHTPSQLSAMNPPQPSPMLPPTPQQQPTPTLPHTPSSQHLASPSLSHMDVSSPPISSPHSTATGAKKGGKKTKSKASEKKESKKKRDLSEEEYKEPSSRKEEKSKDSSGAWTQDEINKLLEAQEIHGNTAYKLIAKEIGTRNANQVRSYISKLKKKTPQPPAKKGRGSAAASSNPSTPHVSSSPNTPHNNSPPPVSFMDPNSSLHLSSEGLSLSQNPLTEFPNITSFDNEGILDFLQEDDFRDLPVPSDLGTIDNTDNLFGTDDLLGGQEELTNTDEFFA